MFSPFNFDVTMPAGRSIGAQSVERMETASLRGRRRRNLPNEDEEESLDDLLKTVDSKPVAEEASKGKKAGNETEDSGSSRRESVTKLPTGRQIKQQVVCNSLFVHFVVVLLKVSNFSPL